MEAISKVTPQSYISTVHATAVPASPPDGTMLDSMLSKAVEGSRRYDAREQTISELGYESNTDILKRTMLLSERSVELNTLRSCSSIVRTGLTDLIKQQ